MVVCFTSDEPCATKLSWYFSFCGEALKMRTSERHCELRPISRPTAGTISDDWPLEPMTRAIGRSVGM